VPGVVGVCAMRELLLRRCFGPSNSDVGAAVVLASSLLGRPRSPMSRLAPPRAVAAERVMPPRGCFAAWASAAAQSPCWWHLHHHGCIFWVGSIALLGGGSCLPFLVVSLCLSSLGSQPPSL
jgi:hypothetical protein